MALKRITTTEGEVYFVDKKTGERVEVDQRYTKAQTKPEQSELISNPKKTNTFAAVSIDYNIISISSFVFTLIGWLLFLYSIFELIKKGSGTELFFILVLISVSIIIISLGYIINLLVNKEVNK